MGFSPCGIAAQIYQVIFGTAASKS